MCSLEETLMIRLENGLERKKENLGGYGGLARRVE